MDIHSEHVSILRTMPHRTFVDIITLSAAAGSQLHVFKLGTSVSLPHSWNVLKHISMCRLANQMQRAEEWQQADAVTQTGRMSDLAASGLGSATNMLAPRYVPAIAIQQSGHVCMPCC